MRHNYYHARVTNLDDIVRFTDTRYTLQFLPDRVSTRVSSVTNVSDGWIAVIVYLGRDRFIEAGKAFVPFDDIQTRGDRSVLHGVLHGVRG